MPMRNLSSQMSGVVVVNVAARKYSYMMVPLLKRLRIPCFIFADQDAFICIRQFIHFIFLKLFGVYFSMATFLGISFGIIADA